MPELPAPPTRDVSIIDAPAIAYSFGTLVTRLDEYREMVHAFVAKGFTSKDCEFLYVDNSTSNRFDAFSAYNRFLQEARGQYVVLCHQDILPIEDDRQRLDARIAALDALDPDWALCGNAGGATNGKIIAHISHTGGEEIELNAPFPQRVMSLDENFIVVRRDANLALSHDLTGFHWYGSDLCLIADILGWHAYVIDFHLLHKSRGNVDGSFFDAGRALRRKYAHAFRSRWQYVTTLRPIFLSSSPTRTFIVRALNKIKWTVKNFFDLR